VPIAGVLSSVTIYEQGPPCKRDAEERGCKRNEMFDERTPTYIVVKDDGDTVIDTCSITEGGGYVTATCPSGALLELSSMYIFFFFLRIAATYRVYLVNLENTVTWNIGETHFWFSVEVGCISSTSGSIIFVVYSKFIGDPHFYGFKGQKYDVMGQSYEIYNIITAPYLQINSRFTPYYKTLGQAVPTGTMMGELGTMVTTYF
jgi:hypothetical protein